MTDSGPLVPAHPGAASDVVSKRMSRLRRRDTKPELAIRSLLHAAGLRYRVTYPVPGQARRTIDIAFARRRVGVFVDGCFWHACPEHGTAPHANSDWWQTKFSANRQRDIDTTAQLEALGWLVIRVWEHEAPEDVVERIKRAVADRARSPAKSGQ